MITIIDGHAAAVQALDRAVDAVYVAVAVCVDERIVAVERAALGRVLTVWIPVTEDLRVYLVFEECLARKDLPRSDEHFEVHVRCAAAVPARVDGLEAHPPVCVGQLRSS